jgi:hypothetical protein
MVSRKSTGNTRSPRPLATDSDVITLALVTAEALEAQGETQQSARWLRRAADRARMEGNEERAFVLARAAAVLAKAIGACPRASSLNRAAPIRSSSPRAAFARTSTARTTSPRMTHPHLAAARASSRRPAISPSCSVARMEEESSMEAVLALMGAIG